MNSNCTQFVAKRSTSPATATINNTCPADSGAAIRSTGKQRQAGGMMNRFRNSRARRPRRRDDRAGAGRAGLGADDDRHGRPQPRLFGTSCSSSRPRSARSKRCMQYQADVEHVDDDASRPRRRLRPASPTQRRHRRLTGSNATATRARRITTPSARAARPTRAGSSGRRRPSTFTPMFPIAASPAPTPTGRITCTASPG